MKKILMIVILIAILGLIGFIIYSHQQGTGPSGEQLLPEKTMIYSGCRHAMKLGTELQFVDFTKDLQELGLSDDECQRIDRWVKSLRRVHFGLSDITLVPFSLNAVLILEGNFKTTLTDMLPASRIQTQPAEPYRDIKTRTLSIPLGKDLEIELFITDPVQNRIFITSNRKMLTETLDRLLDGGPSLADNPDFQDMINLPEIRTKDVISYFDLKEYFNLLFGMVKVLPFPAAKQGVQIAQEELRLNEWGPAISGMSFMNRGTTVSFTKLPADLPLYQQLEFSRPVDLSGIPADTMQAIVLQVKDAALARRQLTSLIERITVRAAPLAGVQIPPRPVEFVEQMIGFSLTEIDPLLSGEFVLWQSDLSHPKTPDQTFGIGITDAAAVRRFLQTRIFKPANLTPVENNGIYTLPGVPTLAWSIQPTRLIISSNPEKLAITLQPSTAPLTGSAHYQQLKKQLPEKASYLQYVDYSGINYASQMPANVPSSVTALFTLMKNLSVIQTSVAENGMLRSDSVFKLDLSPEELRAWFQTMTELMKNPNP